MLKTLITSLIVSFYFTSFGFEKEGHLRIEKEGINLFRSIQPTENNPSGEIMYQYLLSESILKEGSNSAKPDMDLARQFLSDRQVYHFMANKSFVTQSINGDSFDENKLLTLSLQDCINMLYISIRETIENPVGAHEGGRGTYSIIHAIVDSYSLEHVVRDSITEEIEIIKSWRLSKLFWHRTAKLLDSVSCSKYKYLHSIKGDCDKIWQNEDGKLNIQAQKASEAVKLFLTMLYQARKQPIKADELTVDFIQSVFKPKEFIYRDTYFFNQTDTIFISFNKSFNNYSPNSIKFDLYPRYSHMIKYNNDFTYSSFGYEFGFRRTPSSSSNGVTFIKRLPYGLLCSIQEHSGRLMRSNFIENIEIQVAGNTGLYFPFSNIVLEPKAGISIQPALNKETTLSAVIGLDLAMNFGNDFGRYKKSTKVLRGAVGYEYNSSKVLNSHSIVLKLGFNTRQGRLIKIR